MNNTVDLLQIKIEKARAELSEESRQAIDAVDWKNIIIGMRVEKGYSFTQLEDLEIETELLLCGLLNPEDYPKELEKRMGIPKPKADELVNEMNEKVFKKIREKLIKNIEGKKVSEEKGESLGNLSRTLLDNGKPLESREELLAKIENPNLLTEKELPAPPTPSILSQKLSGAFQIPGVETDHSLENITKNIDTNNDATKNLPKVDPYRMPIE